ncbi:MAG: phosphatase domain-containing protein [Candidatus Hodarchaeales archaeon]
MILYWLDKQRFGGSSEPSISDLPFLQSIEIGGIVCLQEKKDSEELAQLLNVAYLHRPIPDYDIPTKRDIEDIIEFFKQLQKKKPNVPIIVHCTAGNGRTGTVLASIIKIVDKKSAELAIKTVREVNPLAIETSEQENFVRDL